jgi:hypothetical protein
MKIREICDGDITNMLRCLVVEKYIIRGKELKVRKSFKSTLLLYHFIIQNNFNLIRITSLHLSNQKSSPTSNFIMQFPILAAFASVLATASAITVSYGTFLPQETSLSNSHTNNNSQTPATITLLALSTKSPAQMEPTAS